jgi:hypothetical protein
MDMKKILILAALALAGCSDPEQEDPELGKEYQNQVKVAEGTWRVCDGTTALYIVYNRAITAVPNSPQCK